MSLMREVIRIAGAAIVFAVLALAPTAVKAHQGHSHSSAAVHHSVPDQEVYGEATLVAQESMSQSAAAASFPDQQPGQNGCTGTCCKSAMACCVVIFNHPGETPLPTGNAKRLPFSKTAAWPTLDPDRLRRPPKSFA